MGARGRALVAYLTSAGFELRPWEHRTFYDVFEAHAREYSPDLDADAKHAYLVRLARRVLERATVSADNHDALDHAERIWQLVGPSRFEPYAEVIDVLRDLRSAGYPLAVVSNWHCGLGHFAVELGLASYFDAILASAEVGYAKPAPEIFRAAADRLGLAPGAILHVGDTLSEDFEGARAAGFHAMLLDREGGGAKVWPVVRTLADLPDLLERMQARIGA